MLEIKLVPRHPYLTTPHLGRYCNFPNSSPLTSDHFTRPCNCEQNLLWRFFVSRRTSHAHSKADRHLRWLQACLYPPRREHLPRRLLFLRNQKMASVLKEAHGQYTRMFSLMETPCRQRLLPSRRDLGR